MRRCKLHVPSPWCNVTCMFVTFTNELCLCVDNFGVWYQSIYKSLFTALGNKIRADEQKKKEKAVKEEQKRAYGAILQLKQRQRAEVIMFQ